MQIPINLFNIVLLTGAAQGIFLASLLLFRHGNKIANRILAVLMAAYSVFIVNSMFINSGMLLTHPLYIIAMDGFPFLFGPLHYLYAKYLISGEKKFDHKQWMHFIPFIIFKIYMFPAFLMSHQELLSFINKMEDSGKPLMFIIFGWGIAVQGLTYMVLTIYLINKYSIRLKDSFSSYECINLNWLRNITYMTMAVWIIVFIENLVLNLGYEFLGQEVQIIGLLTAVFVYIMGYMGLSKAEIFSQEQIPLTIVGNGTLASHGKQGIEKYHQTEMVNSDKRFVKYQKSGLSPETARQYVKDLLELMEKEQPFKNSNLTLQELSDKLSISTHNLSEVINTQLKQNFFDFVNRYRIADVKKAFSDPGKQHLKILSIALESGFNSKTSFNTIFKKFTRMTPSEYRNKINAGNN